MAAFGSGLLLALGVTAIFLNALFNIINMLPKPTPYEPSWAERVDAEDTSLPFVDADEAADSTTIVDAGVTTTSDTPITQTGIPHTYRHWGPEWGTPCRGCGPSRFTATDINGVTDDHDWPDWGRYRTGY